MPDSSGTLSADEKQTIQKWLTSRMKDTRCPVCGSTSWTIGDQTVIATPVGAGGSVNLGGKIVPLVQLVSNECGYVRHFMAIPMGIKF